MKQTTKYLTFIILVFCALFIGIKGVKAGLLDELDETVNAMKPEVTSGEAVISAGTGLTAEEIKKGGAVYNSGSPSVRISVVDTGGNLVAGPITYMNATTLSNLSKIYYCYSNMAKTAIVNGARPSFSQCGIGMNLGNKNSWPNTPTGKTAIDVLEQVLIDDPYDNYIFKDLGYQFDLEISSDHYVLIEPVYKVALGANASGKVIYYVGTTTELAYLSEELAITQKGGVNGNYGSSYNLRGTGFLRQVAIYRMFLSKINGVSVYESEDYKLNSNGNLYQIVGQGVNAQLENGAFPEITHGEIKNIYSSVKGYAMEIIWLKILTGGKCKYKIGDEFDTKCCDDEEYLKAYYSEENEENYDDTLFKKCCEIPEFKEAYSNKYDWDEKYDKVCKEKPKKDGEVDRCDPEIIPAACADPNTGIFRDCTMLDSAFSSYTVSTEVWQKYFGKNINPASINADQFQKGVANEYCSTYCQERIDTNFASSPNSFVKSARGTDDEETAYTQLLSGTYFTWNIGVGMVKYCRTYTDWDKVLVDYYDIIKLMQREYNAWTSTSEQDYCDKGYYNSQYVGRDTASCRKDNDPNWFGQYIVKNSTGTVSFSSCDGKTAADLDNALNAQIAAIQANVKTIGPFEPGNLIHADTNKVTSPGGGCCKGHTEKHSENRTSAEKGDYTYEWTEFVCDIEEHKYSGHVEWVGTYLGCGDSLAQEYGDSVSKLREDDGEADNHCGKCSMHVEHCGANYDRSVTDEGLIMNGYVQQLNELIAKLKSCKFDVAYNETVPVIKTKTSFGDNPILESVKYEDISKTLNVDEPYKEEDKGANYKQAKQSDNSKNINYRDYTYMVFHDNYKQYSKGLDLETEPELQSPDETRSELYTYIEKSNYKKYIYNLPNNFNNLVDINGIVMSGEGIANTLDVKSNYKVKYMAASGYYDFEVSYKGLGENSKFDKYASEELNMDSIPPYTCSFEVKNEIIKNPGPGDEPGCVGDECPEGSQPYSVNVIYRPIDLDNPFPGIDNSCRDTGYNWCEFTYSSFTYADTVCDKFKLQPTYYSTSNCKCDERNSKVSRYILNNRGVSTYDIYTEKEPLYTLTLTPALIKDIRKNSDKYGDYTSYTNFTCTEGTSHCYSEFINKYSKEAVRDTTAIVCTTDDYAGAPSWNTWNGCTFGGVE